MGCLAPTAASIWSRADNPTFFKITAMCKGKRPAASASALPETSHWEIYRAPAAFSTAQGLPPRWHLAELLAARCLT